MKIDIAGRIRSLLSTRSLTAGARSGVLDPATPRALWRLIQIGESARLITPADQDTILAAFGGADAGREAIGRVLHHARCSVTQLYVLVALFAAEPHPESVPALAQETGADPASLRLALNRLEDLAAISRQAGAIGESPVSLTPSGRELAVTLTYCALRLAVSPRYRRAERS